VHAFHVAATGSTPHTTSYSVTDGTVPIGTVTRHADAHNGARWLAYDPRWNILGCYATQDAAIARLAKAVRL
jgi:hypothetical protein